MNKPHKSMNNVLYTIFIFTALYKKSKPSGLLGRGFILICGSLRGLVSVLRFGQKQVWDCGLGMYKSTLVELWSICRNLLYDRNLSIFLHFSQVFCQQWADSDSRHSFSENQFSSCCYLLLCLSNIKSHVIEKFSVISASFWAISGSILVRLR